MCARRIAAASAVRRRPAAWPGSAILTWLLAAGMLAAAGCASLPPRAPATSAVEHRRPDGSTPLEWAVYRGNVAAARRLLRAGANPNDTNDYGATPLSLAAVTGNAPIIKLLLKYGADANSPNADGETALMLVARTGNLEAAKLLLRHGANVNARGRFRGQTALMWASARRKPRMMELLIDHGADIGARSAVYDYERHVTAEGRAKTEDTGGLTPLMFAARENCLACVNVLIAHHVNIDQADPDGYAPVTIAILNADWDIAKRLIEAGCDVNQWDIYGQGPLYAAVDMGNVVSDGRNPTDPTSHATEHDIVRLLLDHGANPNMQLFFRPKNRLFAGAGTLVSRGTTPLIRAAASGDATVVKMLLAHGADVHLYQADHETPMIAALSGGGPFGGGSSESQAIAVLEVLHAAGADVNVLAIPHPLKRTRGGTALHFATRHHWKRAMALLIAYGADVNAKDADGLTALDYAMGRGYVPFLGKKHGPQWDLVKLLHGWGATVQLAKAPYWPPQGPPLGYAVYKPVIWPLGP
ncbi:MAG: ankyrin repeat domain-containing protein [Steroidobacteraceae bacterium]